MKIYFATGNRHKLREAQAVLAEYGIEVESIDIEKDEDGSDMHTIAKREAKKIADMTGKQVMVDDTGVFFHALNNFPAHKPKRIYQEIGYEGLLKKLEGKTDRTAHFESAVAFCRPKEEPVVFIGKLEGEITEDVYDKDKDVMTYSRIFRLPDGRVISTLTKEEKNAISHRAKAFRKLGEYLSSSA